MKDLLGELERFKDDHKTRHKNFLSSVKLVVNDSSIDKTFESIHGSFITKIKNSAGIEWIVKTIME